jgi:hypothetical protein
VGAAVVLAGAAAFGIDQAVSSSPTHSGGSGPGSGTTASTLPGGLASLYLATTPTAVVSIDLTTSNKQGAQGTASTYVAAGKPPTKNTDFVVSNVTAALHGSQIEISFNGGPKSSSRINGGSFTVRFPMPDGTNVRLTFHPTTVNAITSAEATFKQRF